MFCFTVVVGCCCDSYEEAVALGGFFVGARGLETLTFTALTCSVGWVYTSFLCRSVVVVVVVVVVVSTGRLRKIGLSLLVRTRPLCVDTGT